MNTCAPLQEATNSVSSQPSLFGAKILLSCKKKRICRAERKRRWFREKKDKEPRELGGGVKPREHARTNDERGAITRAPRPPLVSSRLVSSRLVSLHRMRRLSLPIHSGSIVKEMSARPFVETALSARILLYMSSHTIQRRTSSLIGCRLRLMELWLDRKWTISVPRVPIEAPVMAFEPCSCK